jgi:hypothetical protein
MVWNFNFFFCVIAQPVDWLLLAHLILIQARFAVTIRRLVT